MQDVMDKYYLYHSGDCFELRQSDCYIRLLFDVTRKQTIRRFDYPHLKVMLEKSMNLIDDRAKEIIRMRYGLNGDKPLSYAAIGEQLGVTAENIRQIKERALMKMSNGVKAVQRTKIAELISVHRIGLDAVERIFIDDLCNLYLERKTTILAPIMKRSGISITFHTQQIEKTIFPESVSEVKKSGSIVTRHKTLEELDLSVRTYNCLKHSGINTVGDILNMNDDALRNIRNLGIRSYEEVKSKMKDVFSLNIENKDGAYYTRVDIEYTVKDTTRTKTVCFDTDTVDLNILINLIYELMSDRDNLGANVFDTTLSMQTKNYLLLKGYFYLSDILVDYRKIADGFEQTELSESAEEIRTLSEGLASAVLTVDKRIFTLMNKYNIHTVNQLTTMAIDDIPIEDGEAILELRKWCDYNVMFAANTLMASTNPYCVV